MTANGLPVGNGMGQPHEPLRRKQTKWFMVLRINENITLYQLPVLLYEF